MIDKDTKLLPYLHFCGGHAPYERVVVVGSLGGPMTDEDLARIACVSRRTLYLPDYAGFRAILAARRPVVTKFHGPLRHPVRSPDSLGFSNPDAPED